MFRITNSRELLIEMNAEFRRIRSIFRVAASPAGYQRVGFVLIASDGMKRGRDRFRQSSLLGWERPNSVQAFGRNGFIEFREPCARLRRQAFC
jgi:hypothetical protein